MIRGNNFLVPIEIDNPATNNNNSNDNNNDVITVMRHENYQ